MVYLYITTEIPQPEKFALAEKTTVYYNDGTTPIGSYAEQNREIISCADLPDYVGNAIVASEDRSFYTNKGIDPIGIARAFYNNLTTGSRQGGSTITQQYAERYYLGETTSYVGKLREAFLAVKIAQAQDKSQVLCNYMNTIYLGRGAYGIQAAAKAYFGKDAKDLTLSEAAMLAGIVIVVLFAAGALALSEQSRNVLAIAISAALVVFSYTLCKSLGVLKNQKK